MKIFFEATANYFVKFLRRPWIIRSLWVEYNKNVLKAIKHNALSPIVKTENANADLLKRNYSSYDQYVSHQREKYKIVKGNLENSYERRKSNFVTEFQDDLGKSPKSSVLCLGARDGVEVDAMRNLGLLAVGIDLEYPLDSSFVMKGDFHEIPFPPDCFDFLYSNCLDHIFDPSRFFDEAKRVLKTDGGQFLIDVPETECVGSYESFGWASIDDLQTLVASLGWSVVDKKERADKSRIRLYLQKSGD